ncbi:carbohydrate ABC transporter permease [Paenibacillus sp. JX-17]|uniref:Carbohydrate ABC transporter permease n=1 Tax=Paenibacillus lacisoli TaxID=3064525 RepID=A0ABT9CFI9_9BACL|nr:carbohydrate ABC transporter permease [Paenibacillus sp. JX-17]MDO7908025.1 carbohydrate ABC transporter permease [Paenibacillus sp. JX-17]
MKPYKWISRLILLMYAFLIAAPLYFVLISAFKDSNAFFAHPLGWPKPLTLSNFQALFDQQPMLKYFGNSIVVTLSTVLLVLLLGSLVAYAIVRLGGYSGRILFALYVAGLIVPSQVNMLPIYSLVRKLGWSNHLSGLVVVSIAMLLPLTVFMLTGFMRMLNREILEASSIDGGGEWTLYWRMALPLSAPSLAACSTFLFVMVWNDLLIPMLMINSNEKLTLPLALMQFRGEYVTSYTTLLAGVVAAALPIAILFVFLQRYFVEGMTSGAVKG